MDRRSSFLLRGLELQRHRKRVPNTRIPGCGQKAKDESFTFGAAFEPAGQLEQFNVLRRMRMNGRNPVLLLCAGLFTLYACQRDAEQAQPAGEEWNGQDWRERPRSCLNSPTWKYHTSVDARVN